ncbi:MAG: DUF1343 domain-containing protein [Dysgonamonadaceae bacterium]|jgi:uncharacterized protein YbbC (DUF1343 family)|nr:DUF1343 domain-containing protein [Dysgonamonadaceae bacterium]
MKIISILLIFIGLLTVQIPASAQVKVGAESTEEYFPLLKGKRIGVFSNQTGIVNGVHTVDLLKMAGFDITIIFSPEHGFRGEADAGELVGDEIDARAKIPVFSLYKAKGGEPDSATLAKIDVLVIDIQDVGLRFYTYYISMFKLMNVCAAADIPVVLLDRPNPNGFYVDGPILDMKYKSGVGYLPIPAVHGMTLGELALMINGERWLPRKRVCKLTVIKCKNYTHSAFYDLPVPPSPNLPNMKSVYLYPSTCLFEGTVVSLGRGTDAPFQVYGHPKMSDCNFSFIPRSLPGAKNPPLLNQRCYGVDLREVANEKIRRDGLNLEYLIDAYRRLKMGDKFFTPFFEKLIGVDYVRKMIEEDRSAAEIRAMWKDDVAKFKSQRKPYLLYED